MRHYFSALLLSAALLAPLAVKAADDEHRNSNERRYYDRTNKDYHQWNNNENRAYQRYALENHRSNSKFSTLNSQQQGEYWNWRHDHPDQNTR